MNEKSIFIAALDLHDSGRRSKYLAEACRGDEKQFQRLERLLAANDVGGGILDRPVIDANPTTPMGADVPDAGITIGGRYKLLEEIAEGGMGTVWLAQQTEPVRRRVALKLIKPGMDSKQVLARFDAERQALALMDHPNIAKVLDGGVTEQGRPFFAMEYVKGVPITTFCDLGKRTVRDRLKLFIQVCHAVQHAHHKGIIHRDLKPSNILVCMFDGEPVPKVIDFGLAKAMHQPLTEQTLFTAHGLMVGTPLYMSPEQAEFNNLDVDTRSDVYSLGVILYELLTGSTPLDRGRFRNATWQEMARLIKEEEATKPSTKISKLDTLPNIAAQRSLEPSQLSRLMRGDLDWIVMKALEKDRSRRYETASAMAQDIQRYLDDQPVEACPPSALYKFRKFARRNRALLATAALVSGALVAGTVVSTWQMVRARAAEHDAEVAWKRESIQRCEAEERRQEAEAEKAIALKQRAQAEANLKKSKSAVDRYFALASDDTLFPMTGLAPLRLLLLDSALEFYQDLALDRTDDPELLADLATSYARLAEINHDAKNDETAVAASGKAMKWLERLRSEFPNNREPSDKAIRNTLEVVANLATQNPQLSGYRAQRAQLLAMLADNQVAAEHFDQAAPLLSSAIEIYDQLVTGSPDNVDFRKARGRAYLEFGRALNKAGQPREAETPIRTAIEAYENLLKELPEDAGLQTLAQECRAELADIHNQYAQNKEAQNQEAQPVSGAKASGAPQP